MFDKNKVSSITPLGRSLDPEVNPEEIISLLNEAIATEMVCMLRYRRHYYTAKGINADVVKKEFLEHSDQEFIHADMLAKRIEQLGGDPAFNPELFRAHSHADYSEATGLEQMIRDNLEAERIAIANYRRLIERVRERDPTTRKVIEDILAVEEAHASELMDLLGGESF